MTALLVVVLLAGTEPSERVEPAPSSWAAFQDVAKVLLHPRCMNCHPAGEAPLQTDQSRPHRMLITRDSERLGVPCTSCHRARTLPGRGMPPGVPHWQMPSAEMPMVFEGRTPVQLCEQLKDPARNGRKTLADLVHHVEHDALVQYGWSPGEGRTPVPVPHARFVARMKQWVAGGAPCAEPVDAPLSE